VRVTVQRIEVERVLRALEPRLRGLALRTLHRAADVDDVVQEVSARTLAAADGFRGDSALPTWIYRIAVGVIADWVRSPFRRRSRPLADGADPRAGPHDAAAAAEERDRVRGAVLKLPPEQRLVLMLREYEGLRYREIAAVLGIPIGTVESRLHAARRRVAEDLSL
jgi:RNA polymerase sigma-70 factor (ECF subfamily)